MQLAWQPCQTYALGWWISQPSGAILGYQWIVWLSKLWYMKAWLKIVYKSRAITLISKNVTTWAPPSAEISHCRHKSNKNLQTNIFPFFLHSVMLSKPSKKAMQNTVIVPGQVHLICLASWRVKLRPHYFTSLHTHRHITYHKFQLWIIYSSLSH